MSDRIDLVIVGADVLGPRGLHRADVGISGSEIVVLEERLSPPRGAVVLDGAGCVVLPGFVDLHTHLREPGGEDAETVASGARAAALGGYTAIVAMPNTNPAIDSASIARDVLALGDKACIDVAVAGAITLGRRGERLVDMAEMAEVGVRIFTDDGSGVQDASLMLAALRYAKSLGVVIAQHCEVSDLAEGGLMHEGAWSSKLGLEGVPAEAEELMAARDIALAARTGARLHLLHISTAGTVGLVSGAKERGVAVTAEVTPHHLSLTDAALAGFDPLFKVNPPLRSDLDRAAVQQALRSGLIDAVATDHAPHPPQAKESSLAEAAFGMVGLETAFGVVWREVSDMGIEAVARAMSYAPAAIAGLGNHGRPVAPGSPANLAVVDLGESWMVDPAAMATLSSNTPYGGMRLQGRVRHTICNGSAVVMDGEVRQ